MLLIDRREQYLLAVLAAGAEVDVDAGVAALDEALNAESESERNPEEYELLRSLGLR